MTLQSNNLQENSRFYPFFILVLFLCPLFSVYAQKADFDSKNAYRLLQKQCEIGYRFPGTAASRKCADFIENELAKLEIPVKRQNFEVYSGLLKSRVKGINIIGDYKGDAPTSDIMALSAHWDTRPVAEKDPNPMLRNNPIIGANDGASGVAVVLEMARVLKKRHYPGRVLFLFFDLEDSGIPGTMKEWCRGSGYFAQHSLKEYPITAGINFDMIGDQDLTIPPEPYSLSLAPEMTKDFWDFAAKKAPLYFPQTPFSFYIYDDHIHFLKKGIPYIDLIDFQYPYWHTQEDTPDKCSPNSLFVVGQTALDYLFYRWESMHKPKP